MAEPFRSWRACVKGITLIFAQSGLYIPLNSRLPKWQPALAIPIIFGIRGRQVFISGCQSAVATKFTQSCAQSFWFSSHYFSFRKEMRSLPIIFMNIKNLEICYQLHYQRECFTCTSFRKIFVYLLMCVYVCVCMCVCLCVCVCACLCVCVCMCVCVCVILF